MSLRHLLLRTAGVSCRVVTVSSRWALHGALDTTLRLSRQGSAAPGGGPPPAVPSLSPAISEGSFRAAEVSPRLLEPLRDQKGRQEDAGTCQPCWRWAASVAPPWPWRRSRQRLRRHQQSQRSRTFMTGKPGCLTCMPLSMAELSAAGQPGVCASDSSGTPVACLAPPSLHLAAAGGQQSNPG